MQDLTGGGERNRQTVYGSVPELDEPANALNDAELAIRQDKVAVGSIVRFIQMGQPTLVDETIQRAHARKLLGEVITTGDFRLGEDPGVDERFRMVHRSVRAFDEKESADTRLPRTLAPNYGYKGRA